MLMKKQDIREVVSFSKSKKIARYVFIGEHLYKRDFSTHLLKCVSFKEAKYVVNELQVKCTAWAKNVEGPSPVSRVLLANNG